MSSSPVDETIIPEAVRKQGLTRGFVYRGSSMLPTFKPGQLLYIHPEMHDFSPGDVIVFFDPDRPGHVVHRISAISPDGLTTRGDNNLHCDAFPVLPDQVIGRVELVEHQNHIHRVVGGKKGWLIAHTGLGLRFAWRWFCHSFGGPYRWSRRNGWVARVWKPRLIRLNLLINEERLIKYIYLGHTIARWWPQQDRFNCQKPYDLVLRREDLHRDIP